MPERSATQRDFGEIDSVKRMADRTGDFESPHICPASVVAGERDVRASHFVTHKYRRFKVSSYESNPNLG